ncbi:radical SAM protein [uncultured Clostridium sp.]|uniref:radical SAM/SPASM domain-containing protein n=1 Tax=uncultured Clostridium sp. TaxID=59620 RepID=UPI0025D7B816|nr:radical SAM protein [uncultured Clostridium sp.]
MKRFKRIYIEITNVCNLSCNFCPKTKRQLKFMDEETFSHILKEIKPYTDYIYFHLMGEPLLNPNIEKFLELSRETGFKVNITTNGTLLNKVKTILYKAKALRQVNISLHSFEANDVAVDFNEYVEEVLNFAKYCSDNTNIISALRLWNLDSVDLKGENDRNIEIFRIIEEKFNLNYDLKEKIDKDKKAKIGDRIYLHAAEKFSWPSTDANIIGDKGFCYGLRDQLGVLVDGTVVPCCLDSEGNIKLGNILEDTLDEILEGERAVKLYDGFSNRTAVEDLCKRCGYRRRF